MNSLYFRMGTTNIAIISEKSIPLFPFFDARQKRLWAATKNRFSAQLMSDQRICLSSDGQRAKCELVGLIRIVFKTRTTTCLAIVLPGATEVLLGAIPLEGMDVIIDPNKQELALPPDRPHVALTIVK